jgi:hypothetical protein
MTRDEQLVWWRIGYEAGHAAGLRDRRDRDLAAHHAAVAEFRAQRHADAQAPIDALLLDVIDVLARAMLGDSPRYQQGAA